MFSRKTENTSEEIIKNIEIIKNKIIKNNDNFLFYFSPDPDAVGCSIAFALYLRKKNKNCFIYLPEGFDPNLVFLFEIANYNKIEIIKDINIINKIITKNKPVFITCDTPTHFLLPNYDKIISLPEIAIEIDHHFGGDSEQIYENSITLFSTANSCCEILANFFTIIEANKDGSFDENRVFPRNIVLSLLVGICFDTQFGKFLVSKESYEKWFNFLATRLEEITWSNTKNINNAKDVFETISKMNKAKEETLNRLLKDTQINSGIGLLILPHIGKYESLSETKDSTCILSKIISDLSNMIPEKAGKVGILAFYDTFIKLYFYKVRRSLTYTDYDLREIEKILDEIFGAFFLGGGGHPGAVSFRIADLKREEFIEKTIIFYNKVIEKINEISK